MGLFGVDGFPLLWVERLVGRRGGVDGFGFTGDPDGGGDAGDAGDGGVYLLSEVREEHSGLVLPGPGDYGDLVDVFGGLDECRLSCAFVCGVLGRWGEAFEHLGEFPGVFDRFDVELFALRLELLAVLAEDGRWEDVLLWGGGLSFDSGVVLGEGSALGVAVLVLRGEALVRLGEVGDALRLFEFALELGECVVGLDGCVLESAREHVDFLIFR